MFEKAMQRVKKFNLLDFSLFKIVIFLFGIIVGTLGSGFFENILLFIVIIFVILYAILMIRYFKK